MPSGVWKLYVVHFVVTLMRPMSHDPHSGVELYQIILCPSLSQRFPSLRQPALLGVQLVPLAWWWRFAHLGSWYCSTVAVLQSAVAMCRPLCN